jgi:adenylate kinase family enzyme
MGLPHLELDAVQHQPGWREAPPDQFKAELGDFLATSDAAAGGWVVDGNYQHRVAHLLDGADTVVWLDYPRLLVLARVLRRTLGRALLRRELWNGNRERWQNMLRADPDVNIVLWSWTQHRRYRRRYESASAQPGPARWIRLRHPRQARALLRSLAAGCPAVQSGARGADPGA